MSAIDPMYYKMLQHATMAWNWLIREVDPNVAVLAYEIGTVSYFGTGIPVNTPCKNYRNLIFNPDGPLSQTTKVSLALAGIYEQRYGSRGHLYSI